MSPGRSVLPVAFALGCVVLLQGLVGLVAPEAFVQLVRFFQVPPVLYVAALVRVAFGVVLVMAAPRSRMPMALRCLGAAIVLGGLATPFLGVQIAHVILGWWTEGGTVVVRAWALGATAIGGFIMVAAARR